MSTIQHLEYNSGRDLLTIPEYGRHVQKLIKYATTIEDKEKRQAYTAEIIEVMAITNAEKENKVDSEDKLWKHAVRISNFELDVTLPNGDPITRESVKIQPSKPAYPANLKRHRHYGKFAQDLIAKAIEEKDDEKREEFAQVIGSYMKMAYLNWNKNHFVNDESVKTDLRSLSKGKLDLDEDVDLDFFKKKHSHRRKSSNSNRSRKNSRKSNSRRRRN